MRWSQRGYMAGVLFADKRGNVGEIAVLPGGAVDPDQRPAGQHHIPAIGLGGPGDGFQARHVGSEAGHGDPVPALADQAREAFQKVRLRAGFAGRKDIGGIANQRQHPLVAEPAKRVFVRRRADHRVGVELPVAGMQNRAKGRANGRTSPTSG